MRRVGEGQFKKGIFKVVPSLGLFFEGSLNQSGGGEHFRGRFTDGGLNLYKMFLASQSHLPYYAMIYLIIYVVNLIL